MSDIFKIFTFKKGDLFSLFIFMLLVNIGYSQFFLNDLLRPVQYSLSNYNPDLKSIKISNDLNITLIGNNDSTYIVENIKTISKRYQLKSILLDLKLSSHDSRFKSSEDLWAINYHQKNKILSGNIFIKELQLIDPSLFIQLDDNNNISYGFALNPEIKNFKTNMNYKNILNTYSLELKYDDFSYSSTSTTQNDSYFIGIGTTNNNDRSDLSIYNQKESKKIYKYKMDDVSQDFSNNYQEYDESGFKFLYTINKLSNIDISFKNKNSETSVDFIQDDIEVIKINHIGVHSDFTKICYNATFNNDYKIGFLTNKISLIGSSRIRASLISDSMEAAFEAPIINNFDEGYIKSNGIFININSKLNSYNDLLFNCTYLHDYYDIHINNYLLSSFGFPIGATFETLDIKEKEALIINLEVNHQFKKIEMMFGFNQHIPIKIIRHEADIVNEEMTSKNFYGGGFLKMMLIYKI